MKNALTIIFILRLDYRMPYWMHNTAASILTNIAISSMYRTAYIANNAAEMWIDIQLLFGHVPMTQCSQTPICGSIISDNVKRARFCIRFFSSMELFLRFSEMESCSNYQAKMAVYVSCRNLSFVFYPSVKFLHMFANI